MRRRKRVPFIIASLLCLPFLAFFVLVLIAYALAAVGVNNYPDFIGIPLLSGAFFIGAWTFISLPALALVSVFVVMAWFQKEKPKFETFLLAIYSVVLVLCIGYALFCLGTNARFDL
jgi:hypothetical protein